VSKRKGLSVLGVIPFTTAPAPPGLPVPPGTPLPTQSVPTSVVRGPDGAYYVGQLTGFPFPVGAANVWRIEPGSAPEVYASGFTQITDLAFGRDGSLYVLEIATGTLAGPPTPGALIRVAADGTRSELAPGTLVGPTGLALGHRAAYVSNHGAEAGTGEVVRIPLGDH
jgi:sugar lactone lactonase YvrE